MGCWVCWAYAGVEGNTCRKALRAPANLNPPAVICLVNSFHHHRHSENSHYFKKKLFSNSKTFKYLL